MANVTVRRAEPKDIPRLLALLHQVLEIHAVGRSDLFISGTTKYTDAELQELLKGENTPIFVLTDEEDRVQGYAMCEIKQETSQNLHPHTALYIDDLCVDETCRGKGYGRLLYAAVKTYAQSIGAYHITLNVWACNPSAAAFYASIGLKPMKTMLEEVL